MVIKFDKSEKFQQAKAALSTAMANPEATQKEQADAFQAYFDSLQSEVTNAVHKDVQSEMQDRAILQTRGQNVLTSEENKFFAGVVEDGGFADESILPVTTQERIFEDLKTEHPLLQAIGLQNLGAVTRYITADPTKAYAWGPLFGEIKGQVSAAFSEETVTTLKLTSFAVIPSDMLDLGPVWVERFVRTLIVESMSMGLEYGFVNGKGPTANEPIGLLKNVSSVGAVTDKTVTGSLTFEPSDRGQTVIAELHGVVKELSTDEEGKSRKVLNRIVMIMNPVDAIAVQAKNTIQTDNGNWVTSLPYNIKPVESEEMPIGQVLFLAQGEYLAHIAGSLQMKKFDQTLAIEDAILYTAKQFANGKPKDNKAALLYDLEVNFTPAVVPGV